MIRLSRNIALGALITVLIYSCSPQRRVGGQRDKSPEVSGSFLAFCDSAKPFKSLYIKGIDANILLNEEEYNSRVSLYYLPDSVFMISAVNAGFEIVRVGVSRDSTIYINRLDKLAYVIKNKEMGAPPPVLFEDLECLVNRMLLCESGDTERINDSILLVDRSVKDIAKKIYFHIPVPQVWKFEFFQKKTGEYVVGEMKDEKKIIIYSNFIVDDLMLQAEGGDVEYDRILNVNLSVNKRKYEIVYL
jgi:hypothetical protein